VTDLSVFGHNTFLHNIVYTWSTCNKYEQDDLRQR